MAKDFYDKPDFWSLKAIKSGYPARSVYKLQEIDKKFALIKGKSHVLDLGASPGSWTVWLLRKLGGTGFVCAVDLNPLAKSVTGQNLRFLQGDLLEKSTLQAVGETGPYDVIVCDAAPLTTGNRTVDTARSSALVEMALYYTTVALKPGGNFVAKLFQGGQQGQFLQKMRGLFREARTFKPVACRNKSFEIYLVGLFYKI